MIPKTYQHARTLRTLQDEEFTYIQTDRDILDFLDTVGFPKKWKYQITGMVIVLGDGEINAMWVSESNRPYDLSSTYYALPDYRPVRWVKRHLPAYWLEDNEYYQKKGV